MKKQVEEIMRKTKPSVSGVIFNGVLSLGLAVALFFLYWLIIAYKNGHWFWGTVFVLIAVITGGYGLLGFNLARAHLAGLKGQKEKPEPAVMTQTVYKTDRATASPEARVSVHSGRTYTNERLYRPNTIMVQPEIGDLVEFRLDPDNPFDSEAIAAYAVVDGEEQVVAYFNRNRLREMVRDYLTDPARGTVSAEVVDLGPRNVVVDIEFN